MMEPEPQFIDYFLEGITTPLSLPQGYTWLGIEDGKIRYQTDMGEVRTSDPYMHHTENRIIVDEFRNKFPHDSIIVMLVSPDSQLLLSRRSRNMRWEPEKVDLASIAAQWRADLVHDHFEPRDPLTMVKNKIADETGVSEDELSDESLIPLGNHVNEKTNEFQSIFAYRLPATASQLNDNLVHMDDHYKAEKWYQQPYAQTMAEYFGDGVERYAGGEELRARNFIANEEIRAKLDELVQS